MKKTGKVCGQCGAGIKNSGLRRLCEACRAANRRETFRRARRKGKIQDWEKCGQASDSFHGVALLTHAEVAARLGVSNQTVQVQERRAIAKLRGNAEARRLWAEYLESEQACREAGLKFGPGGGENDWLLTVERAVKYWRRYLYHLLMQDGMWDEGAEVLVLVLGMEKALEGLRESRELGGGQ